MKAQHYLTLIFSLIFIHSSHADQELNEYVQKFNKYVVTKAQKLSTFYEYKAEEARQNSKPKTAEKIKAKRWLFQQAIAPLVTPDNADDSYEIIIDDPILKKRVLKELNLEGKGIVRFADVKNIKKLDLSSQYIDGAWDKKQIVDITPLKFFTSLEDLNLYMNDISDLSPLSNLTSLRSIVLWANEVSDAGPLENLINLRALNIGANKLTSVSAFKKLPELEDLWLNSNEQLKNIEELGDCSKKIHSLGISRCNVKGLTFLAEFTNLQQLLAEHNKISDLSPISHLSKLNCLILSNNNLEDISPILKIAANGSFKGKSRFGAQVRIINNDLDLRPDTKNKKALDELLKTVKKVDWERGNKIN